MLNPLALRSFLLLSFITLFSDVSARPTKRGSVIHLPLQAVRQTSRTVHPQILLQQHVNLGHQRLARITGNKEPTIEELKSSLLKVVNTVSESPPSKRFNRMGRKKFAARPKSKVVGGKKQGNPPAQPSLDPPAGEATPIPSNVNPGISDAELNALVNGGLTASNEPSSDNSLGLDIVANDAGYVANILMGNPPRSFRMLADSGSADTWVGSENCVAQVDGGGCGNHTFLGTQSSSSFVDLNKPWKITYGTGNVAGSIVQDDIVLAGLSLPAHTFGVGLSESVEFTADNVQFDGIMGLAQSVQSEQKTLTPVEALAKQGLIQDAITSYKISRLADGLNDGTITFGGLDETKFDPNTLVTVDNAATNGFWVANLTTTTIDGVDTGIPTRQMILDTGTTLLLVPPEDAIAIHQNIPGSNTDGQGTFTVPCTTEASLALTVGGTPFAIDPRDLAFAPIDGNDPTGNCISGIGASNFGQGIWLVGDTFLKSVYFSHDATKNTISLAKLI